MKDKDRNHEAKDEIQSEEIPEKELKEFREIIDQIDWEIENDRTFFRFFRNLRRRFLYNHYCLEMEDIIYPKYKRKHFGELAKTFLSLIAIPYGIVLDFLHKRKWSPFSKEWFFACIKYFFIGPVLGILFFLFVYDESWGRIAALYAFAVCFLGLPFLFVFFSTVFMPTPVMEKIDRLRGYPIKSERMAAACIRSFRTWPDFDKGSWTALTRLDRLNEYSEDTYPIKFFCKKLSEDHIPKSSLHAAQIKWVTYYGEDYMLFIDNGMKLTSEQKKEYRYSIKYILTHSEEMSSEEWLINELIEAEPTMEFQYTFLKHSKLLVRVDPIPGYDYDERVPALLEQFNQTVHPWLRDKVTFR